MPREIEEGRKQCSLADTGGIDDMFEGISITSKVLIPGSPQRVSMMAKQWDEGAKVKQLDREFRVATGTFKGSPITAVSSGIGGPSLEGPFFSLLSRKVDTMIRVGSTGTLREDIKLGDIIINDANVRLDGTSRLFVREEFPAAAAYEVTLALIQACENYDIPYYVGTGCTTASFFAGQGRPSWGGYKRAECDDHFHDMKEAKVLNFEMEGAALITLSRLFGVRAGMCAAVVANRITGEWLEHSGEERSCLVGAEAIRILTEWDTKRINAGKRYFFPGLLDS